MKELSGREKCICGAAAAAIAAAACHSFERTVVSGVLSWEASQPAYARMIAELSVLFLLFVLIGRFAPGRKLRIAGLGAVAAVFLWIHVALVPVLASGLYLLYVCMTGAQLREWFGRMGGGTACPARAEEEPAEDPGRDFLVGSLAVICLFCLMSALGIGSIPAMWTAVGVTAAGLIVIRLRGRRDLYPQRLLKRAALAAGGGEAWTLSRTLGTALVLTVFCLQAGRMNIAVDYDTMWYGARAAYILNNGRGIYENLGTVGVVYTYSKGWETLTLPLSVLPSYSFLISASWWMAAGGLCAAYSVACRMMNRRMAAFLAVFLSTVPAVMNMTLTAKTDMATLLVQLLMIRELLRAAAPDEEVRPDGGGPQRMAVTYSLAAFLLSWTFKPTALVFSTAVYGMSAVYLLFVRKLPLRCPRRDRPEAAAVTALSLCGLAAIWARTWLLTGLPVTSVFSSLFTRLGFRMKYPYAAKAVPDSGQSLGAGEKLTHMAGRLYGLLLNPDASEDMSHVIVAWGGLLVWYVLWIGAAWLLLAKRPRDPKERQLDGWLKTVCTPFVAVNLISLYLLLVVDGNYFMLLYVLLALAGFRLLARLGSDAVRKTLLGLAVPVMAFAVFFMTLTNWSWTLGLSPVNLINRGYYDHREIRHAQMAADGCGAIWDVLAQDPRNRLIVIGEHPEELAFPCSAQSFVDISGADGNVELVAHAADFVELMEYAGTDYVYVNGSWVGDRQGAWELVYYLIEYGYLVPIHYEADHMLAEVRLDGRQTEESEARSEMFAHWKQQCLGE